MSSSKYGNYIWESIYYVPKIFRKTNISYPLIRTRTGAYQGVGNVGFSENFAYVLNGWTLSNAQETTKKCFSILLSFSFLWKKKMNCTVCLLSLQITEAMIWEILFPFNLFDGISENLLKYPYNNVPCNITHVIWINLYLSLVPFQSSIDYPEVDICSCPEK